MATTVAFSDLDNWLQSQPANTTSTPYELEITGLSGTRLGSSETSGTLGYILNQNNTKYVDLSATEIPYNGYAYGIQSAFKNCSSLVVAPDIPDWITTIRQAFQGCTSLVCIPEIKNANMNLLWAFQGCTAATTWKQKNIIPEIYTGVFKGCTNLKTFYSDIPYELKTWLNTIKTASTDNFPNDVATCTFYLYSEVAEIPISNLENTLSVIETNTISTPYKIKVTELTTTEIENRSIRYALTRNASKNKYVDLSETVMPNGIESLEQQFTVCDTMIKSPQLPQGVVNLKETFAGCRYLGEAPLIPDTVENMAYTFRDCYYNLVTPPVIPEGVTNLDSCFRYCESLLTPPRIPNSAENVTRIFYGCWALTQMPNIPTTVLNIQEMFYECRALTEVTIPSHITNISSAFRGCTSLETVTIESPSSITNCANGFYGCTSLATVNIKSFDSTNIDSYNYVFGGCTNLTEFYCDEPYNLKTWLNTIYTESTSHFPNDVANCHFYLYSEPAEISITTLSDDLSALTGNTTSTPFEIKVTDLTSSNLGDLNTALTNNSTKFVDISETVLPSGMLSASSVFSGCVSLIKAPVIPDSVTIMVGTFENCSNLAEAPDIPDGVTSIRKAFSGCSSITSIEKVSSTVTNLSEAFKNCSSLESIEEFDVPLSVLKTNAQDCFDGCTSLTSVGIHGVDPITEASEWHVIRLNFGADNVSGKVYDKDKNTTTIPQTTIQKGTLKLPVKTDELWFPPSNMSDAEVDEVIESVIDTKRTYFNKDVLNPLNKSFVLWKDSQSQFVSNIDFGGGGGSGITVYDTEEELEEDLPNLSDGDIVGTYGDGEPTFNDAPLGSTMSYLGNTDPSDGKWLVCDGRDTTGTAIELETHYPNLYMFLGGTNVLPEIFDHSRPSAIETFDLTRTNQAVPYDGHIIDTCATNSDSNLYVNDVLVGYNMYYNGNRNTCVIPVRKGDLVRRRETTVGIYSAMWYKHHKIIKAVSYVDYYHAPASEIAQIEQYFDNGIDTVKNNGLSYSTTETLTGGKWIDGKPIYRLCEPISGSVNANAYSNVGAYIPTNMDFLIKAKVTDNFGSANLVYWDSNWKCACKNNVTIPSGTYLIAEYTKTTD